MLLTQGVADEGPGPVIELLGLRPLVLRGGQPGLDLQTTDVVAMVFAERFLDNGRGLPGQRLGAGVVDLQSLDPGHVAQAVAVIGMPLPQVMTAYLERLPRQWCGLRDVAL